jgi:hypothetical protein
MGEGPGSCGDTMDNDGDGLIDLADPHCQCHFKVASAIGSIDWNMDNKIEGISQNAPNKRNIGAVIREPWFDGVPWCATAAPGQTLKGYDDWSHIKLIFRQAGAFGPQMPHGPVPFDEAAGGYREDTDADGLADIADNCPNDANPDQADNESDGIGDVCDPDDDNDLMLDTYEEANTCLDPLVRDAWTNDDSDELNNCPEMVAGTDPCVAEPELAGDTDTDSFSDGNERYMGTDHLDDCPDNTSHDARPPDIDMNTVVDVTDALLFLAVFPSAPGCSAPRLDLAQNDGVVDITDALIFLVHFPSACTNP